MITKAALLKLNQLYPKPKFHKPIGFIGTGAIAQMAQIPCYMKENLNICGLCDINREQLEKTADIIQNNATYSEKNQAPKLFDSASDLINEFGNDIIYDIPTAPHQCEDVLHLLPDHSTILLQKPFGTTADHSQRLFNIIEAKSITAAVNFQLRYSALGITIKNLINLQLLGEIENVEVNVQMLTPFHLFPWFGTIKYCEIYVYSIHLLDFIRSTFGNPTDVYCSIYSDTKNKQSGLDSTRLCCHLNYKNKPNLKISVNVNHHFKTCGNWIGNIQILGDKGNIFGKFNSLEFGDKQLDTLSMESELILDDNNLFDIPLCGNWMMDSFYGPMANLQRFVQGEDDVLYTRVEDVMHTMNLVESLIKSHEQTGYQVKHMTEKTMC